MSFADRIPCYGSVSLVGLAKNAGKTECLNYVLGRLADQHGELALTSIGIDGESLDQVTHTRKPEITVGRRTVFVTSEAHYRQRRLLADILGVSERRTALGRLITARALIPGKVILSGPATTAELRALIARMKALGVRTTLVDGALSRLSLSSPAVTDAMVLSTGAAVSRTVEGVVNRTAYVCELIAIPRTDSRTAAALESITQGVWGVDDTLGAHDLGIRSALGAVDRKESLFRHGHTIFTPGAVGDKFLDTLTALGNSEPVQLIVSDFTRIFAGQEAYRKFLRQGGTIRVLRRTKLLAVTVNPLSPEGYRLDSQLLRDRLTDRLNRIDGLEGIEVCDVLKDKP